MRGAETMMESVSSHDTDRSLCGIMTNRYLSLGNATNSKIHVQWNAIDTIHNGKFTKKN